VCLDRHAHDILGFCDGDDRSGDDPRDHTCTGVDRHGERGAVTGDRRRRVADALVLVGGAALVASAFSHWVSRGYGSGLRGHELVDALISVGRHFPGLSAARLTILWYLVPALGASSWIASGWRGADSRAARVVAAAAAAAAAAAFAAFGWLVGYSHLGTGAWLAVAGAAALVVGSWVLAPAAARPTSVR
jgi:hypothetical protein